VADTSLTGSRAAYAALVAASMSWGVATATSKVALSGLAAFDLLLLEISAATVALWCAPATRSQARRDFRRGYLALGLLEPAGAYALFNLGLERTSASDAALLVSLEGLVVAALAAVLLRERAGRALVAGLALGVAGAAVLAEREAHHGASLHGDVLVLGAVVAAGLHSIATRRLAPGSSAVAVTGYQLLGATVAAVPIWLVATLHGASTIADASAWEWIAAVATGVLGSALPLLLFTFALARLPSTRAAPVVNLVPLFGVAASALLLGERLSAPQLLGGLLILGGLGTAQVRRSTR
jgi:drug/metabolite transporter (DMT)-like permease